MFPILPILILLLLGPANAERLAAQGRLPAGLLAVHLAQVPQVRATVQAPIVEEERTTRLGNGQSPLVDPALPLPSEPIADGFQPGWPARAGPAV